MDETTPNQWAPPTPATPADNTPDSAMPEPSSVVLIEPPLRRRRAGLLLAVALVVLAGLGVGTFFILRGDDAPTYSLDRAAVASAGAKWSSMQVTVASDQESIKISSESDGEKGLAKMNMDLGASGPGTPIDMIVDTKNDVMFMSSDAMKALGAPVETKWVKIDRAALTKAGQDASFFDQLDIGDQMAAATLFTDATDVKQIGKETIDGEVLQHDDVTVPTAKVIALNPFLKRTLEAAGTKLPDTITYGVYITKDNVIRRLVYEFGTGSQKASVTVVAHVLTASPGIEVPAEADVTDIASLL